MTSDNQGCRSRFLLSGSASSWVLLFLYSSVKQEPKDISTLIVFLIFKVNEDNEEDKDKNEDKDKDEDWDKDKE